MKPASGFIIAKTDFFNIYVFPFDNTEYYSYILHDMKKILNPCPFLLYSCFPSTWDK
jgi:hypothetical protein